MDAAGPDSQVLVRAAFVIAAVVVLGSGTWFATSWVDTGGDATCGAVVNPGIWLETGAPHHCRSVMAVRGTITAASLAVGGSFVYLAIRSRPTPPLRAATALAIAAVATSALLVINEVVRSDGAF
jgi:hypothetical protein